MANQKVNERGVSKLAEIWVKSTEVEGHEILPHFPRKIKQKSRQNSSFSIQWNGQAPRETNQFEQNTGTKISLSSKISLKFAIGFAFRA